MVMRKRTTRKKTTRRKSTTKRSTKPIGYTKQGKSYKLVFGTKTKPRLGASNYRSKAALTKAAQKYLK